VRGRAAVLAVLAVLAAVTAACGPTPASVGHGRHDSWIEIHDPAFTAASTYGIGGLAAPVDGYPRWTAAGNLRAGGAGSQAAVWTSSDGARWGRVELDGAGARETTASGVATGTGRAVVVGTAITPLGDKDARIWTSTDGATWDRVNVPAAPGDQSLTAVAAGPLGFVAAGVARRGSLSVPAVWWSLDGIGWRPVEGPFAAGQAIEGLAVGRSGVVAVGTLQTGGEIDGMVWFSGDGTTWRTVPLGSAGFTGRADQRVHSVTATAAGGFVAVGDDANADRRIAVVWNSPDGITWQRQPFSPDMAEYADVTSTGGVGVTAISGAGPLVAVGGGYGLQLWTSPDGRRWTRDDTSRSLGSADGALVANDGTGAVLIRPGGGALHFRPKGGSWSEATDATVFPVPPHAFSINALARAGGRFLAFGRDTSSEPSGGSALWMSPDGRAWERQPDPQQAFARGSVSAAVTFHGLVVAAGTRRDARDEQVAAVWVSPDAGATWERVGDDNPAFFVGHTTQMFGIGLGAGGLVAVGLSYDSNTIDAHAWYSPDGRNWKRGTDPPAWSGPGDQVLDRACSLPDGGVVVLGLNEINDDRDVMAWVSADGASWQPSDIGGTMRGPGDQRVDSCAPTSSGLLVAGDVSGPGGFDSALWSSPDGRTWQVAGGPDTFAVPGVDWLQALAVDGQRVVATGVADFHAVVFTSSDGGTTWRRREADAFAGFGLQVAGAVLIVGDQVVATGTDGSSGAVWIGPAP
jgi:hypothetical protein